MSSSNKPLEKWWLVRRPKIHVTIPISVLASYVLFCTYSSFTDADEVSLSSSIITSSILSLSLFWLAFRLEGWYYDTSILFLDNLLCMYMHVSQTLTFLTHLNPHDGPDSVKTISECRNKLNNNLDFIWKAAWKKQYTHEEIKIPNGLEPSITLQILRPVNHPLPRSPDSEHIDSHIQSLPLVLWIHGGGHCLGTSKDSGITVLTEALSEHDEPALIVSVEYRLAPEHVYPAAADDCIHTYEWLCQNASALGADLNRMAVAGISAGGNLAAIVHQHAARHNLPLKYAGLLIPEVNVSGPGALDWAYVENGRCAALPTELMAWFMNCYCPDPERDATNPKCSPLFFETDNKQDVKDEVYKRLASCLVVTNSADALRDCGLKYIQKLEKVMKKSRSEAQVDTFMVKGSHSFGLLTDRNTVKKAMRVFIQRLFDDHI